MRICSLAPAVALILQVSAAAWAQSTVQQPVREENLSEKIINPIAFLMRMTLENKNPQRRVAQSFYSAGESGPEPSPNPPNLLRAI